MTIANSLPDSKFQFLGFVENEMEDEMENIEHKEGSQNKTEAEVENLRDSVSLDTQQIEDAISERFWLGTWLEYFAERLAIRSTDAVKIILSDISSKPKNTILLDIAGLSIKDSTESKSAAVSSTPADRQDQLDNLRQRLRDAVAHTDKLRGALTTLMVGIIMLKPGVVGLPTDDKEIAFRVFSESSYASLIFGEFRCANWRCFDIKKKSTREEAASHIKGDDISSDYISISTSPRRTWNILKEKFGRNRQGVQVAAIDMVVLRRLGLPHGSTTDDLEFHSRSTAYATKHHILVKGYIPLECIIGHFSPLQFNELLKRSDIDLNSSTTGHSYLAICEKRIPFRFMKETLTSSNHT